jgi:hypothetical protein
MKQGEMLVFVASSVAHGSPLLGVTTVSGVRLVFDLFGF